MKLNNMDNSNQQLARLENGKIIDIISKIQNLTEEDRYELSKRVVSDDIEIRKDALEKITQSQIAQNDLIAIIGELSTMSKQGMYVKSKQTIKTGSGQFEIEMKGGDTKLIIPVLVIVGIVIIAALVIIFWR
jgi:predicted RND superfamily exporter protein